MPVEGVEVRILSGAPFLTKGKVKMVKGKKRDSISNIQHGISNYQREINIDGLSAPLKDHLLMIDCSL